jgi:triacylglycerol lipase
MPAEQVERWWGRPLAETRWALEAGRLSVDPVFLGLGVPRGDRRPVILMSAFMAGDQTLAPMAGWLFRIGYLPYGAGFIANVDCSDRTLDRLERRLERVYWRHGRRVALVGHSRGGHFVRALARRRPEQVSHAISLGADLQRMFGISVPTRAAAAVCRRSVTALRRARSERCLTAACDCAFARDFGGAFPTERVRLTSIYSKGDGVVHWTGSVVSDADCVEVTGSHVGLICNRKSYRALATALAQPEL